MSKLPSTVNIDGIPEKEKEDCQQKRNKNNGLKKT